MRLQQLEFEAIGPFPGRHRIDFADLTAAGLFLLEGPTGAGKSTLIDAIVFALYGSVASQGWDPHRMRSDHVLDDRPSWVELTFETASGLFRVRRSPQYERSKRRSAGTTTVAAKVTLWRRLSPDSPDWEVLATKTQEADAAIRRAVGLTRDQFAQTVVLPQGLFASFLTADSERRRPILQQVFGTALYDDWMRALAARRAEAQDQIRRRAVEVESATRVFAAAAGLDARADDAGDRSTATDSNAGATAAASNPPQPPVGQRAPNDIPDTVDPSADIPDAKVSSTSRNDGSPANNPNAAPTPVGAANLIRAAREAVDQAGEAAGLLRLVRAVLAGLEASSRAAQSRSQNAAQAAETVRRQAEAAQQEAQATAQRRELSQRLARWEAEAPRLSRLERQLEAARRAAPALPLLQAGDQATAALAQAESAAQTAGVELGPDETTERWQEAWARSQADQRAAVDRLTASVAAAEAIQEDTAQAVARERTQAAQTAAEAKWQASNTAWDRLQADGPGADQALARAGAAAEAAAEHAVVLSQLDASDRGLTAALARLEAASGQEAELRERRLGGLSAELADGLAEGQPCPVCGATAHPALARPAAGHVGAERVAVAATATREAATEVDQLRRHHDDLQPRLTALAARGGAISPDQAQLAVARARAARADLGQATELRRQLDRAAAARQRAADQAAAQAQAAAAAHDRRVRLEATAGGLTQSAATIAAAAAQAVEQQARAAWRAADELVGARRTVRERLAAVAETLTQAGFADPTEARAAGLAPARLTALEKELTEAKTAQAALRARLDEPDLARATGDPALAAATAARLQAEAATAVAQAQAARDEAAVWGQRAADGRRAAAGLEQACADWEAARDAGAAPIRIADLATAAPGNLVGVTLPTYVLLRRFEEVVAAANDRLTPMSDGRFALERSDSKEATRARRTGLALKIVDAWTGQARDPRSLSGGETFYVSLALALGLADVVTAEAGGVDLGTLLIDEGFGALSPEVLDGVLAELGKLRASGRVVGLVSHVDSLKQAIAERIEVRRQSDGSSTLTVRA